MPSIISPMASIGRNKSRKTNKNRPETNPAPDKSVVEIPTEVATTVKKLDVLPTEFVISNDKTTAVKLHVDEPKPAVDINTSAAESATCAKEVATDHHKDKNDNSKWVSCGPQFNTDVAPRFALKDKLVLIAAGATVRVHSAVTGERIGMLSGHGDQVTGLVVDQMRCLSCSLDGTIRTWDYSTGSQTSKICVGYPCLSMAVTSAFCFVLVKQRKNTTCLMRFPRKSSADPTQLLIGNKNQVITAVAVSIDGTTVACTVSNKLVVFDANSGKSVTHCHSSALNSVCFHPTEQYLCTGDSTGRIILWYNFSIDAKRSAKKNSFQCVTSVLHWHSQALNALQFTEDGTYLLSGGKEQVLVQWQMHDGHRHFLPRLGGNIQAISISSRGDSFAISCADNSIRIISGVSSKVRLTIRGLLRGTTKSRSVCHLQADSRLLQLGHLALAGSDSRVQFYDPINERNILQIETNAMAINRGSTTSIDALSMSFDGDWMAVAQKSTAISTCKLLFFQWDPLMRTYQHRTSITEVEDLNSIVFCPISNTCVSLANTQFSIWKCTPRAAMPRIKKSLGETPALSWSCLSSGQFRKMKCKSAAFSSDGSILAVVFDDLVTLWNMSTLELIRVLFEFPATKSIGFCGHHLIIVSDLAVSSWDVFSAQISWSREIRAICCAFSPSLFAIGSEKTVSIFKGHSEHPIIQKKSKMSALTFILNSSSLIGMTEDGDIQRLQIDALPTSIADSSRVLSSISDLAEAESTPLEKLFGKPTKSSKATSKKPAPVARVGPALPTEGELFTGASHIMPPVEALYASLMQRLNPSSDSLSNEQKVSVDVVKPLVSPVDAGSSCIESPDEKIMPDWDNLHDFTDVQDRIRKRAKTSEREAPSTPRPERQAPRTPVCPATTPSRRSSRILLSAKKLKL